MDRPLRIGIAGVAHPNAAVYAQTLRTIAGVALAGVWDAGAERASALATACGAAAYTELSALLGQSDALIVTSATIDRPALVAQAAQAGMPVLCEPPLATTSAGARAMIAACAQAGVQLAVSAPMRYHQALQQLRQAVRSGALGELLYIRTAGPGAYPAEDWRANPQLAGGGALIDRAGPLADLLRWLTGRELAHVYAEAATRFGGNPVEDAALLLITLDGGLSASLDPSWSRLGGDPSPAALTIEITGSDGVAYVDAFAQHVELFTNRTPHAELRGWGDNLPRHMLADWLRSVRAGSPAPVAAADGLRALDFVFAAYRSAELHEPVVVE